MKIHSKSHLSQLTKGKCTHAMPCHAVLRPYLSESDFSRPRHSTAWARHGICELTSAVERGSLGDLASFGYFRLPCGIPRRLSSESQNEMQLASVKPNNVCHGRGEADYFGARTWMLYNLQHKDYNNNLWTTIYGDLTLSVLPCMHSDVYWKVDQHAANVKRVATDMLYHMFSLNTIKCLVSICEKLRKSYIIGLLFVITLVQMSLLLETSDFSFSLLQINTASTP